VRGGRKRKGLEKKGRKRKHSPFTFRGEKKKKKRGGKGREDPTREEEKEIRRESASTSGDNRRKEKERRGEKKRKGSGKKKGRGGHLTEMETNDQGPIGKKEDYHLPKKEKKIFVFRKKRLQFLSISSARKGGGRTIGEKKGRGGDLHLIPMAAT